MLRSTRLAVLTVIAVMTACTARQEPEGAEPTDEESEAFLQWMAGAGPPPVEAPEGAEAFGRQYMEYFVTGEMEKMAGLYDPDELEEFKNGIVMIVAVDTSGAIAGMIGVRDSAEAAALPAQEIMARGLRSSTGSPEEWKEFTASVRYELEEFSEHPSSPDHYIGWFRLLGPDDFSVPFPVLMKRIDGGWRAGMPPGMREQFESMKSFYIGGST